MYSILCSLERIEQRLASDTKYRSTGKLPDDYDVMVEEIVRECKVSTFTTSSFEDQLRLCFSNYKSERQGPIRFEAIMKKAKDDGKYEPYVMDGNHEKAAFEVWSEPGGVMNSNFWFKTHFKRDLPFDKTSEGAFGTLATDDFWKDKLKMHQNHIFFISDKSIGMIVMSPEQPPYHQQQRPTGLLIQPLTKEEAANTPI
jgi:hypothetical protein